MIRDPAGETLGDSNPAVEVGGSFADTAKSVTVRNGGICIWLTTSRGEHPEMT